jgi:hypothetical protein
MHENNAKTPLTSESRRKFFNILADYWKEYGLPGLCGYIDALLLLEEKENWTQTIISKRFKQLFGIKSEYPTSVASVNRAISINVQYGTVIRKGSHKLGYTYHVATDVGMLTNMFQRFIDRNDFYLDEFSNLQSGNLESEDSDLNQAIQFQLFGIRIYNESLKTGLESLKEKLKEMYN